MKPYFPFAALYFKPLSYFVLICVVLLCILVLVVPVMTIKGGTSPACAVCKYQRRKCSKECALAPYFPADKPEMFQNAHRLFGVRNITRILEQVEDHQKAEAMRSIIYESDMRSRFPVHGCLGAICQLQFQTQQILEELHCVTTWLQNYKREGHFNCHQVEPTTSNVDATPGLLYQHYLDINNESRDDFVACSDVVEPSFTNITQLSVSQGRDCDNMALESVADNSRSAELLVKDTGQLSLENLGEKEIRNFLGHTSVN